MRSTASRSLLAFALAVAATTAHAQSLTLSVDGRYGSGPAGTVGSSGNFDADTFGSVDAVANGVYNVSSDEGLRYGNSQVAGYGTFGSASTTYDFSTDNSLYNYLSGDSSFTASDSLTLTNSSGATEGKYRIKIDIVKTGNLAGSVDVFAAGFGGSGITSSTTLLSDEYTFSYGSSISADLQFMTSMNSGLSFGPFDTGSVGGGWSVNFSYILTDLGGATFSDIGQSSNSGTFYDVQGVTTAVPGPAAAVAFLGGLARRRRR